MHPTGELANKAIMLIGVVVPFLGFVLAIYLAWNRVLFTSDIVLFLVMSLLTGLGVTIGYHRMLTHHGFDAPSWLRGLFLILGCMAFAGSKPDEWAATHIRHHAHSDEDGDPHSPLEGFWHAHLGWLFGLDNFSYAEEFAPHLLKDPVVMFVSRTSAVWMVMSFLIPFLIGGWTGLLWGGVVRLFWTTHTVWSVNSVCHSFGERAFETNDESRNEWVVGLLAFGEGWHNNHHAFPTNAFHGMRWWQFDLSGLLIRALESVGLVWNVQRVAPDFAREQQTRMQAMNQALAQMKDNLLTTIALGKKELTEHGAHFMQFALTDEQREQYRLMQLTAIERMELVRKSVAESAHLKRQKLAQYQKEMQTLILDCRQKWAVVSGNTVSA